MIETEKQEKKTHMIYHIQTDEGVCLIPRTYIQIFLPNIKKLWYDVGSEGLDIWEKSILAMYMTSRKQAGKLVKGGKLMEEYIDEARNAQDFDNYLRQSYDKELSLKEDAKEEERLTIANSLLKNVVDKKIVIKSMELSDKEMRQLGIQESFE